MFKSKPKPVVPDGLAIRESLGRAIAYKIAGNQDMAEKHARQIVELLDCGEVLK